MQKTAKRLLAAVLGAALCVSAVPVAAGAEGVPGTPYGADGGYDVAVPHVVVNQVFGASDDAEVVSHSFIELYNQADSAVSLDGWHVYYKSSEDGDQNGAWLSLALEGEIAAKGYYLIRCGEVDSVSSSAYLIPEGDAEWDVQLHNKGVSVALFDRAAELPAAFAGAVTEANRPEGYVDVLAVQGNDAEDAQIPPVYEGNYEDAQSKKKAIRREGFADTDDNAADAADADYSELTPEDKPVQNASGETIARQSVYTVRENGFEEEAALGIEKAGAIKLGDANADGGVAEIVAYNGDNGKAYVVDGQDSVLDVFDVNADGSFGTAVSVDIAALMAEEDADFVYGDMTSVAVDTVNDRVAVALQDSDYAANGRVAVLNYDNEIVAVYETGVQPDMITFAADGRYILTANEGEPRMGYGDGTVDPEGSVTVIDTQSAGSVKTAGFSAYDSAELAAAGVIFNRVDGEILSAARDLEPEYIAVNGTAAYVSLQEANAIAVLDIGQGAFTGVYPLGFKDYSLSVNAIDLNDADGDYAPKTYNDTYGVYMPDGIAVYEAGGKTYLLTANEGDAREWGDFTDEEKRTLTSADGTVTAEDVRVLDNTRKAGIGEGNYLYGARSFSVFSVEADGLRLVFDSANDFEAKTWEYLPEFYNASNDDADPESRTAKKGTEPEAVAVAEIGGKTYAFVALERIGGIMVYDVTDPADAQYVNYVNTRDFNGPTEGDVAPEGLAFAEKEGAVYLLAAFEVSGTVAAYELTAQDAETPDPTPDPDPGTEPDPNPGSEAGDDGGNDATGWIIGGCVAGVVVIGAAVAFVLLRRRKKQ